MTYFKKFHKEKTQIFTRKTPEHEMFSFGIRHGGFLKWWYPKMDGL